MVFVRTDKQSHLAPPNQRHLMRPLLDLYYYSDFTGLTSIPNNFVINSRVVLAWRKCCAVPRILGQRREPITPFGIA